MKAVLSDIHGNLEALHAVLRETERLRVDSIYNLGDITGYGPDPVACIDLSMSMAVVVRGNFDNAIFTGAEGFGLYAEQSITWTQHLLEDSAHEAIGRHRVEFLAGLPSCQSDADVLYVHGSPRNHLHEYVFPDDIHNRVKMEKIGMQFEHVCFIGHTHRPGIFIECRPGDWQFLCPAECEWDFKLDDRKVICNVGSVGQPRDGNWRAGYVLFDGTTIYFRRVEYDVEATIKKIYAVPELGNFSGDRLRDGR